MESDDYLLEQQRFESSFFFRCPHCKFADCIDLIVPEFNFNVESMGDLYSEDAFDFSCPECETEFFGHVSCSPVSCEVEIHEPVAFTMTGDAPMFSADPAAAYEPPSNPHELLVETLDRCRAVARMTFEAKNDPQFRQRMAFVTIVTALETYLADTLLNEVKGRDGVLLNLVNGDRMFSEAKIPLKEFVAKPDFASEFVRRSLQEVAFHNLPRASRFYQAALGINLSGDKELWARLNERTAIRHDCVHRNGHNENGERRDDITPAFVESAATDVQCLADYLERKLFEAGPLEF